MTPVFGTGQPLHGLSGALRRAAYSIRENKARHWMLLLLADRVEVWERRIARMVKVAAIGTAGVAGLVVVARVMKRA
jgi:transcriptional regulator GlxA family with amidase domain